MRRDRSRIQCTIVQEKETVAKEKRQIDRQTGVRDINTGGERDRNKGKELELTRDLITEGERLEQS
jgi:hypothetical protein